MKRREPKPEAPLIHVSMGLHLKATPDTERGERNKAGFSLTGFSLNGNPRRKPIKRAE